LELKLGLEQAAKQTPQHFKAMGKLWWLVHSLIGMEPQLLELFVYKVTEHTIRLLIPQWGLDRGIGKTEYLSKPITK
jgi:hypothetical protein